jgi:hypothetical protein
MPRSTVDITCPAEIGTLRAMKLRTSVVSLLVSLMVVLTSMVWASPVDPTWIKGVYDDGDHDDVMDYLTSNAFGIPILPVYRAILGCVFAPLDMPPDGGHVASPGRSPHPPRAPPLN